MVKRKIPIRYGSVTERDIAYLARRADRHGQLGLACVLYTIAGSMRSDDLMGLPRSFPTSDAIEKGMKIDLSCSDRRATWRQERRTVAAEAARAGEG